MSGLSQRGVHPVIESDHPYIFIDSCMQSWPDANYSIAHQHGVTAYGVTTWMPEHCSLEKALEDAMFWHYVVRENPGLMVATTTEDIRQAKAAGRAAFIFASQSGNFIADKLHRLEAFYRLGLRIMIPAYNASNMLSGGCLDAADGGLTSFGRLVVQECNRLGIVLDGSHVGRKSTMDMMNSSSQPVIFSHSNVKALVDNPRNIDDEQIRACVATGGVIGLAPYAPFIMKEGMAGNPTLDDFVDHVDYVADLSGSSRHIGIGTDMSLGTYSPIVNDPWGMPAYQPAAVHGESSENPYVEDFTKYPHVLGLIDKLQTRGYSDQDTANILGENYLRVFEQVWR